MEAGRENSKGGKPGGPELPPASLGLLFGAAAVALALLLVTIGVVAYFLLAGSTFEPGSGAACV